MRATSVRPGPSVWLLAARPKTLPAAVAPVLIGTAMALEAGGFHFPSFLFALLGALFIQIGTNYSNDYHDFIKGADTEERKGPLRATQAGLVTPAAMRRAAALAFGMAFLAGLYLIWRGGWPILLIGVLSILSGIAYTAGRYSLAYLGLGDVFVLIFFGPVAVGGTYYVQALSLTPEVLWMGVGAGLLSVAILLANNIRDVEEDRRAGKMTLVARFGRNFGIGLYAVSVVLAAAIPVGLVLLTDRSFWAASAAVIAIPALMNVQIFRQTREPARLNPLLGATARLLLWYSVIFVLGWNV